MCSVFRNEAPYNEHNNCSDDSTNNTRALAWAVESQGLAQVTSNNRTHNTENCSEDETRRFIGAGR